MVKLLCPPKLQAAFNAIANCKCVNGWHSMYGNHTMSIK